MHNSSGCITAVVRLRGSAEGAALAGDSMMAASNTQAEVTAVMSGAPGKLCRLDRFHPWQLRS